MKRKIKYTVYGVLAFVVLFLWGLYNDVHAAELEARLGLSIQAIDRDERGEHKAQEMMVLWDKDWYFQASRFGDGTVVPDTWRYSLGYRVEWREERKLEPFMRFGAAYWYPKDSVLVSDRLTYDMAVGMRLWQILEAEFTHNSSAGRSSRNSGVDMFGLYIVLPIK